MKKNYLYAFATALMVGSSSCSDFLDRYPQEGLSDGNFWKTPDDANKVVSDLYGYLSAQGQNNDINSGNAAVGIKWAAGNIPEGVYDPADQGWSGDYTSVRQCNLILSKIDEIPDYPEVDKTKALEQVYFFRVYIYLNLICSFGDVPYIDKPLDLEDMEGITRMPRAEVYEEVMADFDRAIAAPPTEQSTSDYGRVTKEVAMAMKARVALCYGNWDVAAKRAKNVMDLGLYELYGEDNAGKYAELFWGKAGGCNEFILVTQFNYPGKTHYLMGWGCFPTKGQGGMNPTQSLVDAFGDSGGAPIGESKIYDPADPFKSRDSYLEVDTLHDGEEMYGVTIKVAPLASSGSAGINQHNNATEAGYYGQKWLDPGLDPQSDDWNMGKDWVHIRYVEILLTYTETMNGLKGLNPAAFDAVDQVRRHVGIPELQNTGASKPTYCATRDDLRQYIRNEWRVEFCLGDRRRMQGIRRQGIAKDVLNTSFEGLEYKIVDNPNDPDKKVDGGKMCIPYRGESIRLIGSRYSDNNYLFPIPQSGVGLNPALTQNPGY